MNLLKSYDLLAELEQRIPLREPELKWSEKETAFYIGQRSVINLIETLLEDEASSIPEVANID